MAKTKKPKFMKLTGYKGLEAAQQQEYLSKIKSAGGYKPFTRKKLFEAREREKAKAQVEQTMFQQYQEQTKKNKALAEYNKLRLRYGQGYGEKAYRFSRGVQSFRDRTQRQSAGFLNAMGMGGYAIPAVPVQGTYKSRGNAGAGRPRGASGKYVIPGIGPVGVYEYRRWLRTQQRIQLLEAKQQAMQNMQKYREFNQRQLAAQTPMENRTIPNTMGFIPMGHIQKEIDDACHEVE